MMFLLVISQLLAWLNAMNSDNLTVYNEGNYTRIEVDSCYVEALEYGQDSVLVVQTACAPICSSVVRVYNGSGTTIRTVDAPFDNAIFPLATIDNGELRWQDNTNDILDEQEKRSR